MFNKLNIKPGHLSAQTWYADLDARITELETSNGIAGYAVDSRLSATFESVPVGDRADFLDAIGAYIMLFKVVGEPTVDSPITSERIEFYRLSPEDQDACSDALEAENA